MSLSSFILGCGASLLSIPVFAAHYKKKISYRSSLYRTVEARHLANAVVLLPAGNYDSPLWDTRNDPELQNNVLYAHDLNGKNHALLNYFPAREFYRYVPEEKNEMQQLQKILP